MTNELPVKVSVIIPCYNVEKYLRECLDSVVNQTLKEIEIICINDGSPDRSLDILNEYQKQDSRFVIIDQENQGVGRARNNGIKAARGEFICFMDPDDWYPESDVLEVLYFSAKKEGVKICGGSLEEIKEDGTVVRDFNPKASNWGGKFFKDEKTRFSQYQYDWGYQRFIFERKFILDNEIFFPPYIRFQDPPFFVKAMVWAKEFYALRKITYSYRVIYKSAIWKDEKKVIALFDVDGTLVKHNGYKIDGHDTLLDGVSEFFKNLNSEDKVILLTARKEEYLPALKDFLAQNNIRYDYLLTDMPMGERILVNDDKPSGLKCAYAVCKPRDEKLSIEYKIREEL